MKKINKKIIFGMIMFVIIGAIFLYFDKPNETEASWWDYDWNYRKGLTINHNQVVGDLENFPVLVNITDTNFSNHAQEDGDDFVFVDSEGKTLSHEIEKYASSTGELVAWVKVSELSSTEDTDIYMYYGNASVTSQQDVENVWDDNYKMVQHHEENSGTLFDSTANNNDGASTTGMTYATSTKIGTGLYFDDDNDFYVVDDFDYGDTFTVSFWVKVQDNAGSSVKYFYYHGSGTAYNGTQLREDSDLSADDMRAYLWDDSGYGVTLGNDVSEGDVNIDDGNWHYLTINRNRNSDSYFYVDGVDQAENTDSYDTSFNPEGAFFIGKSSNATNYYFYGQMDEFRVSATARSESWVQTEYNNQNNPDLFFTVQAEEVGLGPVGYWSFDEGYGTTVHDESSGGYDGTITAATWQDESTCISGKCLHFDGIDLTRVDVEFIDNMEELTVCTWMKANSLINSDGDAYMTLANKYGWDLSFDNSGKINFTVRSSSAYPQVFSSYNIEINKWYHVCGVFYGINDNIKMYINGADESSDVDDGSGEFIDDSAYDVRIGAGQNMWGSIFNGYIDEVKIYPYARTADQIKQDYNAGLAGTKTQRGTSVSFGSNSDNWINDGLVGYWKMDESATSSGAIDASGNGNDGTYEGMASTTAGKFGRGVILDGDGNFIQISNFSNELDDDYTVCWWVKPSSLSLLELINLGENSSNHVFEYFQSSSALVVRADSGNSTDITVNSVFEVGRWSFICGVGTTEKTQVYVDGLFASETTVTKSAIADLNLNIGAWDSGGYSFNGLIDEVRFYNRALSSAEVRNLYEWAPGPVLHLKMDEKEGTTAYDSSGNENDGTLVNNPTWERGKYGGALRFNGSDSFVNAGSADILDNLSSFTYGAWIKVEGEGGNSYGTIIMKGNGSNVRKRLWTSTLGPASNQKRVTGFVDFDTTDASASSQNDTYTQNNWEYWTMTYNNDDRIIKLYQNGIEISSYLTQTVGEGSLVDDSNNSLLIGTDSVGSPFFTFNGLIDEVSVYNYPRTQKQILEDMNAGRPAIKSTVLDLSFDEGYGDTVHDASGNGYDGTLAPGTSGTIATSSMWNKDGKTNGAMEFDGTDDYVEIGLSEHYTEMTFSAWINPNSDGGGNFGRIVDKRQSGVQTILIYLYDGGDEICFDRDFSSNIGGWCTDYGPIKFGEWQHVVFTYNESSIANDPVLYINGEERELSELHTPSGTPVDNSDNYIIGNRGNRDRTFDGTIDEVKIYNYALTVDEVKTIYNQGKSIVMGQEKNADNNGTVVTGANTAYCIPGDIAQCDSPVLELKMDEKRGTTVYDASGNGNDGSFFNNPSWARGKKGGGLEFNADDNSYISGAFSGISGYPFTLSAWTMATAGDNGSGRVALGIGVDSDEYYGIGWYGTDGRVFLVGQNTGFDNLQAGLIGLNKWTYITGVFNSAIDRDIYVNGVYYGSDTSSVSEVSGINLFESGRRFSGSDYGYLKVDDAKVYDYARTPAQIAYDYNRGKPIAHWTFDECLGSVIHDESGNGYDGILYLGDDGVTATGTCASSSDSFWYNGRDGKINNAGSFDGSSDYVDLSSTLSLDGMESFSACSWYNASFSNGTSRILKQYQDYGFYFGTNYNFVTTNCEVRVGNLSGSALLRSNYLLVPNEWVHLCVTFEANTVDGLRLYINGEEDANSPADTSGINDIDSQGESLYISNFGSYDWYGLLDEIKIYNYALTSEQIKQEYAGGAVRF